MVSSVGASSEVVGVVLSAGLAKTGPLSIKIPNRAANRDKSSCFRHLRISLLLYHT